MTNSLDVAKKALALWRSNYGNESLEQQCIRYDGYYWQWAYQGNENIRSYPTATAAARASTMFTKNINDPSIAPGDLVWWDWGTDGHVGTVIGRQNGRTLVTHTSSRGDTVLALTNNVKVSHADSINLSFIGVSHNNGTNKRRVGLTAWSPSNNATSWERAWGGEPSAPLWPRGALMLRIQKGLAARDRYDGAVDGVGGKLTGMGIQLTIANGGDYRGPIDGALGHAGAIGVQEYGKRWGDYVGPIDGDPRLYSWSAFALGLERP